LLNSSLYIPEAVSVLEVAYLTGGFSPLRRIRRIILEWRLLEVVTVNANETGLDIGI
jgi:hypothetical protein